MQKLELTWIGKGDEPVVEPRILLHDASKDYGDPAADNMLIHGDNLLALKALEQEFAGRVKCIYIDPPYNTGSAFEHYNDNLEHSTWLSLMVPRLRILRNLLSEDGSIWISIDDDEGHYLKVLCDEIFGRDNFCSTLIWEKKYAPQNDAKWFSDNHDFILVYAKHKLTWRPNLLERTEEQNSIYKNPDNDPRGSWASDNLSVRTYNANCDYPITTPGGKVFNPPQGRCWSVSRERLEELIADNRMWFGTDGNNSPRMKRFLSEVKQGTVSKTIWFRTMVGDNQDSKREVRSFNSESVFATPKPERLIERVLTLGSNYGDLVLDSFLGSGTTAAVAHKMGRRWIGVEIGDHAVTHCVPRLQKVVDGEQGGISKAVNWQGGGGFRFARLGDTVFDELGQINPAIRFPALAAHVWFSETGEPYRGKADSALLGVHDGTAYYLLYNGILGDKRPAGGNVLTTKVLAELPAYDGPKVIFGEASRIGAPRMAELGISFRQTPYDIKSR